MKKALTTAGVALALGLFAGVATTAHAEDTVQGSPTDSNAQFQVTPAEGGAILKLNTVPGFTFSPVSQSALISADENGVSVDSTDTGSLNVTDYRGTNTGWSVKAQVGPFNYDKDELSAMHFNLNPDKTSITADNFSESVLGADLVQEDNVLATTTDGAGSTTANFQAGSATLVLPKHATAKATDGTTGYQATIDWTLVGGEAAVPAVGGTTDTNS